MDPCDRQGHSQAEQKAGDRVEIVDQARQARDLVIPHPQGPICGQRKSDLAVAFHLVRILQLDQLLDLKERRPGEEIHTPIQVRNRIDRFKLFFFPRNLGRESHFAW